MTQYRIGMVEDWPAIAEFISKQDGFLPCDPSSLGGIWLIAVGDEGQIRGTVWSFVQAPNAHIGYWAADSGFVARSLMHIMEYSFVNHVGVKHVHGVVQKSIKDA